MNLHHRPVATLDETKQAIETFLAVSKQPVLLEPGEEPLTLAPGAYHIDFTPGRLTIQAWSREQNLSRRVTGIQEARPGVLVLATERFGKQAGTVQLLDLARSKAQVAARRGSRLTYREQFHRSLTRHFPAWEISRLSTEPNLQHTLSPAYPRALLRKGPVAWAAIGASAGVPDASGILSFGLLWLDYARRMEAKRVVEGLILFVPAGQERTTCHRILCLNPAMAQFLVYVHSEDGVERQVDWRDYGNLDTKLPPRSAEVQSQPEWMESVAQLPDVDSIELNDGAISYRVRGLELARKHGESLLMGLETKRVAKASNLAEIEGLARELARMRSHRAVDRQNSLYQRYPELWLESRVRTFIQEVDASLQAA
ncbi:MAG TPA: hypothetical protein VMZ52_01190, partial [Bryobacteraceae bacterium]|nr:hypothetical protein [Bryobacteraceae bacterium]